MQSRKCEAFWREEELSNSYELVSGGVEYELQGGVDAPPEDSLKLRASRRRIAMF